MCEIRKIDDEVVRQRTEELIHCYEEKDRSEVINIVQGVLHKELFNLNSGHMDCQCPNCESKKLIKYGIRNGNQRYQCKGCGHVFSFTERGDIMRFTKLSEDKWMQFAECFVDRLSCDRTADKIGVTHKTAWFMRVRTLEALFKNLPSFQLKEGSQVYVDEIYFGESFKGVSLKKYGGKLPRPAKTGAKGETKAGISNDQICVITGVNDHNEIFYEVACRGALTVGICDKSLEKVLSEGCIVYTDKHHSYPKVLDKLKVAAHESFSTSEHEKLKPINKLHSHIRDFLHGFHGVSTKWLHLYLAYFKWIREYGKLWGRAKSNASNQMGTSDYIHTRASIPGMNIPFRDDQLNPLKTACC